MADKTIPGMPAERSLRTRRRSADRLTPAARRAFPWHIVVFLAPAVLVYTR